MIMVDQRHLPMTHYSEPDKSTLYFISAEGTEMTLAAERTETVHYLICSDEERVYADIEGQLSVQTSKDKLDDLWNRVAAAWFEDGRTDPDVRLLALRLRRGDIWLAESNTAAFLYQVLKGNLSDQKPDVGQHVTLEF